MGVKGLAKLLAAKAPRSIKEQKLEDYAGRSIAIDASLSIYQFLTVVGRKGAETLTNEAGEVTSHLQGFFFRTIRLIEAGMKPIYVFDGVPPVLKKAVLSHRTNLRLGAAEGLAKALESQNMEEIEKYSKRVVQVMPHQNEDIHKLLQLMGVPLVKAPSEAEAECAALCKLNKAFAVASEDMDSLSFGAPRLVRYLLSPVSQKLPIMEYDLSKVLEELKLSVNQFVDLCILAGCDYIEHIKGIGPQTALKLVQKYGSIEVILENLNKERYHIPDSWAFPDARELFHQPLTSAPSQPEFEWNDPNEEGIKFFLVEKNNFNQDRVMKGLRRLEIARNKSKQVRLKPSAISCGNSVVKLAAFTRKSSHCRYRSLIQLNRSLRCCPTFSGGKLSEPSTYQQSHLLQSAVGCYQNCLRGPYTQPRILRCI